MRVLFIHRRLPTQFMNLMDELSKYPAEYEVYGICAQVSAPEAQARYPGMHLHTYGHMGHDADVNDVINRGRSVGRVLAMLKQKVGHFDRIVVHSGWGEGLFVKDHFPNTPLIVYNEYFYGVPHTDGDYDPEFPLLPSTAERTRLRNMPLLTQMEQADRIWCPTKWQSDLVPQPFQRKVAIIAEGVDTQLAHPVPFAEYKHEGKVFMRGEPILTYTAHNLEPYRGFHSLMRSLPAILAGNPKAQVLIAGGDGVSYGTRQTTHLNWRLKLIDEMKAKGTPIDESRVHFLGYLPHAEFLKVLQVSAAHLHLARPFLLSWSVLEAMSCQCHVISNAVGPAQDVITSLRGTVVDFFNYEQIAAAVLDQLETCEYYSYQGIHARDFIINHFELTRCLRRQMILLQEP